MACEVKIRLSTYNSETQNVEESYITLGQIDNDNPIDFDQIAAMIANFDYDKRSDLAGQLRSAKYQSLDTKFVNAHQLISNTSLTELSEKYPELKQYEIPEDLSDTFTLLHCKKAVFNGRSRKGRLVDSKGKEIFVINDKFDAEKLFKHLYIRRKLSEYVSDNVLNESLENYKEDLIKISEHYKVSIQTLLENFLVNKNQYKPFQIADKIYHTKSILQQVISAILGEIETSNKSQLHLDLESIKEKKSNKDTWIFSKKNLFNILSMNFDSMSDISYEQFVNMSVDELNELILPLFSQDLKLVKARVVSSQDTVYTETAPKSIKEVKSITSIFAQQWFNIFKANHPVSAKEYQKLTPEEKEIFREWVEQNIKTFKDGEDSYQIKSRIADGKLKFYYEKDAKPKTKEKNSYITINANILSNIGDIYNFSYNTTPIYTYVENYKGFYIYEFHNQNTTHYAISRNVISPNAFMSTFGSLEQAKQTIDDNKDTLRQCGLWSIKQGQGVVRKVNIEMKNVRPNSIITSLQIDNFPSQKVEYFPKVIKDILDKTVGEFQEIFKFIPNIQTLDTPEKAAAFIFLTYDYLRGNQDIMNMIKVNKDRLQSIIDRINNAPTVHYLVEKVKENHGYANEYYIKKLEYKDMEITPMGNFSNDFTVQTFIQQNLTDAINYFNEAFGINIHAITNNELHRLSQERNLKLEDKLDTVKGFVLDGEIYINTSNADFEDLFHEVSHIFVGILKATNPQAYQDLLNKYKYQKKFQVRFEKYKGNEYYKSYAQTDIEEEALVQLLAEDMFANKVMGSPVFDGDDVSEMLQNIMFKMESFTQTIPDNGLGFTRYIKQLLDENSDKVQRNMKISEYIRSQIDSGKIIEDC